MQIERLFLEKKGYCLNKKNRSLILVFLNFNTILLVNKEIFYDLTQTFDTNIHLTLPSDNFFYILGH